jgi:DNA-binding protein
MRARGTQLKEAVDRMTKMVETAGRMISESDEDMVDKINSKRHLEYVNKALTEMQKSANEVMIHERRMEAACEDIGEGLRKYYDVR